MPNNQVFSESIIKNNGPNKWWHRRWVKTICICFIILTIVAITLSFVLKRNVFAPRKPKNTTIIKTPSSLTTVLTTVELLTTTTITMQQPSKL